MINLEYKSFKDYNYICRYRAFPYYYNREDNKYIFGTTAQLNQNTSYITHTIKPYDTFDSISLYYYNSPLYFWVIMDFNQIQDPFYNLNVGDTLKIPTLNGIQFEEV